MLLFSWEYAPAYFWKMVLSNTTKYSTKKFAGRPLARLFRVVFWFGIGLTGAPEIIKKGF